jgi:hypothetical protein
LVPFLYNNNLIDLYFKFAPKISCPRYAPRN